MGLPGIIHMRTNNGNISPSDEFSSMLKAQDPRAAGYPSDEGVHQLHRIIPLGSHCREGIILMFDGLAKVVRRFLDVFIHAARR